MIWEVVQVLIHRLILKEMWVKVDQNDSPVQLYVMSDGQGLSSHSTFKEPSLILLYLRIICSDADVRLCPASHDSQIKEFLLPAPYENRVKLCRENSLNFKDHSLNPQHMDFSFFYSCCGNGLWVSMIDSSFCWAAQNKRQPLNWKEGRMLIELGRSNPFKFCILLPCEAEFVDRPFHR